MKNTNKQTKNLKTIKHGSYSVIAIVIAIAIAVVVNLIVNVIPSKYTQIDVSTEKLYSIGNESKKLVKSLKDDVTIYFLAQEAGEDNTITQLLEAYKNNSSHIKIEKKDPALYPGFASKYTDTTPSENSLIIECGDKSKVVDYSDMYISDYDYNTNESSVTGFDGEGQITSALAYVTSEDVPKMYVIEGHDESDMDPELTSTIEKMNIEVDQLSLLTSDAVPEDASALMLMAPQSDYSEDDADKVIDYMNKGGKVFIVTNYTDNDMPNFKSVLEACNVELYEGVIIDMDSGRYAQQNPMYLVPEFAPDSNLTDGVENANGYVFAPIAEGLKILDADNAEITTTEILTTSDKSYLKTDPQGMETYTKEDGDIDGPFAVGVSASKQVDDGTYSDRMQAVVYTSASFMTKSASDIVSGGNFTLIKDSLSWMIDADAAVSVESKSVAVNYLTVTASGITLWTIITAVLIPGIFLVIGGVVWFRRRKK